MLDPSSRSLYRVGVRARESRHPVPTRAACLTGAGSQAVCDGMASGAGLEPARAGFRVLLGTPTPTRKWSAGDAIRTRKQLLLRKPGLPVAVTPACAAKGSNLVPRIKSPVHHRSCLQRLERIAGNEPACPGWKPGA